MPTNLRKRPDFETREQLETYLRENPLTELPFLEPLWDKCLELCEVNKNKTMQTVENKVTDRDGNVTITKKGISNVITNPVQQYFKMIALPQYRKKGEALRDSAEYDLTQSNTQKEILQVHFNAGNDVFEDEIISWINMFKPIERDFLMKRYASYFDQYEINEGADKASLKRILSYEIALYRIDLKRVKAQGVDTNDERRLSEMLNNAFESLKWTKKQRSAKDDLAQNKFTVWMDKQVQDGGFTPKKHTYEKDEIDFLIDTIIDSTREMLS